MKKTIDINKIILSKIDFRYMMFNGNAIYQKRYYGKLLADTSYPHYIASSILSREINTMFNKQGYCISEVVAADTGSQRLHISELVTMIGYTKTEISKLLQSVKNRGRSIVLVGVGGTGSNFLHWMSEMSEWVGKKEIFNIISVYDDDNYDIPNMLRIPFVPQFSNEEKMSSKKVECLPRRFNLLTRTFRIYQKRLNIHSIYYNIEGHKKKDTIVYGAPGIETREKLSACNYTFIAATHRDNEFSLVQNPIVDNELMMETYGKINLSKFFLNHLVMTIKFLESIRDREGDYGTTEENDIFRGDFSTMFDDNIVGGFKAGIKKLYILDERMQRPIELNIEEE